MRIKVVEPILLLGQKRFENLNVRVKVRGGGSTSQAMAIRMSIAKGIIAFTQKYDDESTKRELKELLLQYDKGLLIADPRRCEPKKIGGTGSAVIAAAVVMVERHRVLRRRGRVVATATAATGFIGDFRHSARTFLLEEIQKAADFLLREGWHFFENRRLLRKIKYYMVRLLFITKLKISGHD